MKGHIQKRGPNSYRLVYELPRDAVDRRRQGRQTVHGNKRDADAKLREIMMGLDKGVYLTPTTETLGAFLERWLGTYAATATSKRTQQDYKSIVNRYLVPNLGMIPLASLRPEHVQGRYAELQSNGLSDMTVLHTHRLLKQALAHAVKWQVMTRNVCDMVDPPRPQRKEMVALDKIGVGRLFKASETSLFHDLFFFAVYTGVRRSELLALRWENVDLEHGRVHVVAGLHRINGEGIRLLPTKTSRSRRSISLSHEVVECLRQIQGSQLVKRVELGPVWTDTGFVFTDEAGRPLDPGRVSKEFARVRKQAGLNGVRFHDLRHTHASLMLQANVHPKVVSERLGHSSVMITLDTYSHILPGLQEEAAEKFSEIIGDAR